MPHHFFLQIIIPLILVLAFFACVWVELIGKKLDSEIDILRGRRRAKLFQGWKRNRTESEDGEFDRPEGYAVVRPYLYLVCARFGQYASLSIGQVACLFFAR